MGRGLDGCFCPFRLRAVFRLTEAAVSENFGGNSERETPLPIPNRAVKPLSADGTWWATAWESRSPPVLDFEAALRGGFRMAGGSAELGVAHGYAEPGIDIARMQD